MLTERPSIEPIRTNFHIRFATDEQLKMLQDGTLRILEEVGVKFPSEKAMCILSDHGAHVDKNTQIVKFPPDLVMKALSTVPRYFKLGARDPSCDLQLQDGVTYFCSDGCGVETIDFETRQRRPSCKDDVAKMAHIADYLSAMSFSWPMVSAQDYGTTAPLHEMDASWNNTVKHVQSETIMGEKPCQYAVEMAKVISGSAEEMRRRPVFSLTVCTIAPLIQDKEGIEGALVLAEAGVPVGFLAMPTLGTTAPATLAGAYVVGDAEIISAIVLMQLAHPGAPVFHSMMHAWADPRSGNYISYSLDSRGRYIVVDMAHHWKIPCFGGAYGTDSPTAGNWQSAAEVALDPFLIGLAGPEFVTGMGLSNTYTLLYPESIILDADIYHRARYQLMRPDISQETLALDVIAAVGPGGHFLAHKHTRQHMRDALTPSLAHEAGPDGKYRDPVEVARDKVAWILKNYQPEPLEDMKRKELTRILSAADRELDGGRK
jgi:trimethylamine:corrinoid methyltransferase-like protein